MFSCLKLSCQFSKDINIHHDARRTLRKRSIFWATDIPAFGIMTYVQVQAHGGHSTKVSQSKGHLKPIQYGRKVTTLVPPTAGGPDQRNQRVFRLCFDPCARHANFRHGVGCFHSPWLSSFVSFSCGVPPKVSGVVWHSPLNTIVSKKKWEYPGFFRHVLRLLAWI